VKSTFGFVCAFAGAPANYEPLKSEKKVQQAAREDEKRERKKERKNARTSVVGVTVGRWWG